MNKLIQALTAISIVGLLASCEKKDADIITPLQYSDGFGKYTKELTIYDETRENSAVLLVGSNDKSILDMWQSENFQLIVSKNAVDADANAKAFFAKYAPALSQKSATADEEPESDEVVAHITTRFISQNLQPDVVSVQLASLPPYDVDMRGWKYETHYAQADASQKLTCIFRGGNFWHRGYCALDYKAYAGNPWSTIIGKWQLVLNKTVIEKTASPCYEMAAHRKYNGTNPSVTVQFIN